MSPTLCSFTLTTSKGMGTFGVQGLILLACFVFCCNGECCAAERDSIFCFRVGRVLIQFDFYLCLQVVAAVYVVGRLFYMNSDMLGSMRCHVSGGMISQ